MKFNPTERTLTLEPVDCRGCRYSEPQGTEATPMPCQTCHGSGRGPRGGVRGCKACYGSGRRYDHVNRKACSYCGGAYENFSMENFCDNAPAEAVESMPMSVVRIDRAPTWNERHLGVGMVFSVISYDDLSKLTDDELRAKAREHLDHVQAIKIVRRYQREDTVATLQDELVLVITDGGYFVFAHSDNTIQEA